MTELRARAIKELENVPEEHVAEVIDFMAKLQEKEKEAALKESQEAYDELMEIINSRDRKIPADFDYKKEYLEWLDEKYGIAD